MTSIKYARKFFANLSKRASDILSEHHVFGCSMSASVSNDLRKEIVASVSVECPVSQKTYSEGSNVICPLTS